MSSNFDDGLNLWPAIHRPDSTRLYRLPLERGARCETYQAVAEESVR